MHGLTHRRRRNTPMIFHGRSSRTYDFVSRRIVRTMYRRFAADAAAVAPANGAVLDIGTGPGVLLVELATRRPDLRLDGIDLSADMVTAATRNLAPFGERAHVRVGDATSLPYADGSFDLIVSSLSLHHWDHPEQAAPQLARVLRPGGRVVFYDFSFAPFDEIASILYGWTRERAPIRTGVPFLRCVRYALSA
jgi:ubiquinone/menaquinone biosynthesis C-methylase UbiE